MKKILVVMMIAFAITSQSFAQGQTIEGSLSINIQDAWIPDVIDTEISWMNIETPAKMKIFLVTGGDTTLVSKGNIVSSYGEKYLELDIHLLKENTKYSLVVNLLDSEDKKYSSEISLRSNFSSEKKDTREKLENKNIANDYIRSGAKCSIVEFLKFAGYTR